VVDGNGINHNAARIANEVRDTYTLLDNQATVAVRASSDFVRDDQIAAFVFKHDLGSGRSSPVEAPSEGKSQKRLPAGN
jgi:hypothetical protein